MTTEFVMFLSPPIELRTLSILDQRVWSLCLCVCLLMCPFAYLKNRTTKFSPNFPYIHVTVLLWRECNTLCTSGVVKLHGCFPVVEAKTTRMFRPVRQMTASVGRQTMLFGRISQVAAPRVKSAVSNCILFKVAVCSLQSVLCTLVMGEC